MYVHVYYNSVHAILSTLEIVSMISAHGGIPSFLISEHLRCNPSVIDTSVNLVYLYIHMNIKYQLCCLDDVDSVRNILYTI